MGSIKTFQGIMRKIQAFGNLGHAPGLSGNWFDTYIRGVLNPILTESDKLTPFILQDRENRNEMGKLHRGTEFSEGLPGWAEPLQKSL
jgi:hypothetical protein